MITSVDHGSKHCWRNCMCNIWLEITRFKCANLIHLVHMVFSTWIAHRGSDRNSDHLWGTLHVISHFKKIGFTFYSVVWLSPWQK